MTKYVIRSQLHNDLHQTEVTRCTHTSHYILKYFSFSTNSSILLAGLEFNFMVRDFLWPWHWFHIDFNVVQKCVQKFVLTSILEVSPCFEMNTCCTETSCIVSLTKHFRPLYLDSRGPCSWHQNCLIQCVGGAVYSLLVSWIYLSWISSVCLCESHRHGSIVPRPDLLYRSFVVPSPEGGSQNLDTNS